MFRHIHIFPLDFISILQLICIFYYFCDKTKDIIEEIKMQLKKHIFPLAFSIDLINLLPGSAITGLAAILAMRGRCARKRIVVIGTHPMAREPCDNGKPGPHAWSS
ncbi:hypothetical protein [Janthinobacterium sp. UMAB-56]|uniref:hypothetical protein n=1 Tax=Janthinobacterium sp. UMAB-56 TaxID=1365361 RepID=UPI001C56A517|nr:hypothetical protein [Janthinobacterium sp. UMAB-56]